MADGMRTGTSVRENALIWFGAGVSLAEILTGTYYAGMGMGRGFAAILLGHLIGGALMLLAGMIGGRERKSAMETVALSFGKKGAAFFAFLNVLQLVGWTAIMIYDGALAAGGILPVGRWFWALVIGALIVVWIMIGLTNLGKLSTFSMAALLILSLILCFVIFRSGSGADLRLEGAMSFGAAVELAVAMPLSWLPLISDYTREAAEPERATLASVLTYSAVSVFMYMIGMGAASLAGESDISVIMVRAGLGVLGLVIVVLSTVTTTFLDAYSAGVSLMSITRAVSEKTAAVAVAVTGTVCAVLFPMDDITDFLYLIGSVFAPMIAVQIADYFFLKKEAVRDSLSVRSMLLWAAGFVIYRIVMRYETPVGTTLPCMAVVVVFSVLTGAFQKTKE